MAKSTTRVEFNEKALVELMQSPGMLRHLSTVAAKGKAHAESISPRDTGRYAESFEIDVRVIGDRLTAVITNTAPHAVLVELYNKGTGERIMARMVEHLKGV